MKNIYKDGFFGKMSFRTIRRYALNSLRNEVTTAYLVLVLGSLLNLVTKDSNLSNVYPKFRISLFPKSALIFEIKIIRQPASLPNLMMQ